tara:strand:- start:714 stop:887 length:174 start_codon:yes stop_codon:yes gene_type:complete
MNLKGTKREKPFTLKLANGKEKSFRTGSEMQGWYAKNKDHHQSRKNKRPKKGSKNKQ